MHVCSEDVLAMIFIRYQLFNFIGVVPRIFKLHASWSDPRFWAHVFCHKTMQKLFAVPANKAARSSESLL